MQIWCGKSPVHPEDHRVRAISSQQHGDLMHGVVKSEAPLTVLAGQLHQRAVALGIQDGHCFSWEEGMILPPPQGMRHAQLPAEIQAAEHERPVREVAQLDFSGGTWSKDLPVLVEETDLEFETLLGQEANVMGA